MGAFRFPKLDFLLTRPRWARLNLHDTFPLSDTPDPVLDAVKKGVASGNVKQRPTQEIRKRARAVRDHARERDARAGAISELLGFVENYPSTEEFQKIVARLLWEVNDERALEAWLGISLRFPQSMDAFHNFVQIAQRRKGPRAVSASLQARFPRMPKSLDQLLAYAEACDAAGEMTKRRAAFDQLSRMLAKRKESWLNASSWLEEEWGRYRTPGAILKRLAGGAGLRPQIVDNGEHLRTVIGEWEEGNSSTVNKDALASVRVLDVLFDRVLQARQSGTSSAPHRKTGSLVLLTGSLATGGAERQLVTTAVGLSKMSPQQRTLRDGVVLDPVRVIARSLCDRKDGQFFLTDLEGAGITVQSYRELPDFAGDLATSAVRPALRALGFLPWSTAEAVMKLTDHLRSINPEVVHIWQDGLVFAAGFAALLAGVPRIILSGRSTPPPDRRENYLVEYDIIYRSLLRAPGVKLTVNSRYAAARYAAWLDMAPERIAVIPNGVAPVQSVGDAWSQSAFQMFSERLGPDVLTVGAVMRLDEVKRPLQWVDAAAAIIGKVSNACFIIVGDGPFRKRMEKRAVALGIAERCLFVGRSACVGFWLSKMDALILLSAHEGLPNALIEAQLAGVPVITSPAGGAPETLISDVTGIITTTQPTPGEIAEIVFRLSAEPGRLEQMSVDAERWATAAFPVSRMLASTLQLYGEVGDSGLVREPS